VAADAVLISRAVGRPVRVQWMREDEHGFDPKGPPQLLDVRGALDASGNIAAWETEAWLPENTPNLRSRPMLAFLEAGIPQPVGQSVAQVQGNAYPSYDLPNMTATVHWLKTTPLRPSNLRAPGKPGNTFAVESFIDELAAAAKRDPLEFRLAHMKDQAGISILKKVAERMDWKPRPSPNRNQVEGNILQALSRTLYEEVVFDTEGVTSVDWVSYPILTFPDAPMVDVELIGTVRDKPLGAGEAASAPVPAAVGNAVFDAIGVRMRKVPLTPARIGGALVSQRQT
jgi:CO/xanthine dehydrogenase Mo-binding subunit